jgi:ABC-type Fe3+-hydroxamate transport system substrate-binding protein
MHVVSLVPSVTETLRAWDLDPVACTRFCEQPDLPHVGGTKDPDVAAIVALAPDLVIVDEEENRREDYDALVAAGLAVRALRIRSLADVDAQIGALARDFDRPWTPLALPQAVDGRAAFVPIWRRPWIALGAPTYGTSVLDALGVRNVFAADGAYPDTTLEDAAARGADLVVAPSEPYPFSERHRAELEQVAPALLVDGRDLFWWGTRTQGALARLADALQMSHYG